MRSSKLLLFLFAVTAGVQAQYIPGTFVAYPQQNPGYIVSPPTLSLGNGLTPTVVTTQDILTVAAPDTTSANPSEVGTAVSGATTPLTMLPGPPGGSVAQGQRPPAGAGQQAQRPYADFVVGTGHEEISGSMQDSSVSLGEVARQYRQGRPARKLSISNADVDQLNQNTTGGVPESAPQEPAAAPNPARPPQNHPAPVPPFQQKPRQHQDAPPMSPVPQSSFEAPEQLPRTFSMLPLMGALGSVTVAAGFGCAHFGK